MDTDITLDLSHAVPYHLGAFPPQQLELATFFNEILAATDALSRYDQMLKTLHNSEILLAPLRSREAVISSRIEGTISTLDEILRYEAESTHMQTPREVRQDTVDHSALPCCAPCTKACSVSGAVQKKRRGSSKPGKTTSAGAARDE